jgi:hypothetical protein
MRRLYTSDWTQANSSRRYSLAEGPLGSARNAGDSWLTVRVPSGATVVAKIYHIAVSQSNSGPSVGLLLRGFLSTTTSALGNPGSRRNRKADYPQPQLRSLSNSAVTPGANAAQPLMALGYVNATASDSSSILTTWKAIDKKDMIVLRPGEAFVLEMFNTPDTDGSVMVYLVWEEEPF